MEKLQSKTIKYNDGYFTFTNVLTSSVNIPHSTRIEFFSKEKTITKWLGRYLDLDIMDTFTYIISSFFQPIKSYNVSNKSLFVENDINNNLIEYDFIYSLTHKPYKNKFNILPKKLNLLYKKKIISFSRLLKILSNKKDLIIFLSIGIL